MKEPLQKVLRQLLDELSDQKFADLVFRLFVSMPDEFYTGLAYYKNPIPLVEHLILTAVFAFRRVKKWGKGRPRHVVQEMMDAVIIICLFHDFWKFDWAQKPPKRIKEDHGYVSGDKMFEFIKEAKFPKKTKNRIVGTIFFHMDGSSPRPIKDEKAPKRTRAGKFLKGSDGKTYRIYKNKTRMYNQLKVIRCIPDCK